MMLWERSRRNSVRGAGSSDGSQSGSGSRRRLSKRFGGLLSAPLPRGAGGFSVMSPLSPVDAALQPESHHTDGGGEMTERARPRARPLGRSVLVLEHSNARMASGWRTSRNLTNA